MFLVQKQQPNIAIALQFIASAATVAWGMPLRRINKIVSVLRAIFA